MSTRPTNRDRGYSLIELLVVVVIVGVLAAIAVPVYLSQRERGYQAQLVADVRNSVMDVEAVAVGNDGQYPADQAEFDALGPSSSDPAITLTYTTNGGRTEFCVLGTDARLPATANVAHYVNNQGVQVFADCPAFVNP